MAGSYSNRTLDEIIRNAIASGLGGLKLASVAGMKSAVWVAPEGDKWSALWMDRIALGSTGWEIHFSAMPNNPPYLLIDPETRVLAVGTRLEELKEVGEAMHAERLQFRGNRG